MFIGDKVKPYVKDDGRLSTYAWPGGYPLFYMTEKGHCLCPVCAFEATESDSDYPVDADANWENPSLYCDECGTRIESAYAEEDVDGCKHTPRMESFRVIEKERSRIVLRTSCSKCGEDMEATVKAEAFKSNEE